MFLENQFLEKKSHMNKIDKKAQNKIEKKIEFSDGNFRKVLVKKMPIVYNKAVPKGKKIKQRRKRNGQNR